MRESVMLSRLLAEDALGLDDYIERACLGFRPMRQTLRVHDDVTEAAADAKRIDGICFRPFLGDDGKGHRLPHPLLVSRGVPRKTQEAFEVVLQTILRILQTHT